MNIYTPYVYLIGWSAIGQFYYGVRYAKNCHPSDLWVSYFTSSNYVEEFRKEHGEPDIIMVRKTFRTKEQAKAWESKVLKRVDARNHPNLLNKNNVHPAEFTTKGHVFTVESRLKMSASSARKGQPGTFKGKTHSDETKKKYSVSRKGTTTYFNIETQKNERALVSDPRIEKGVLVPVLKGKKIVGGHPGRKGKMTYINVDTGLKEYVSTNDIRIEQGLLVHPRSNRLK